MVMIPTDPETRKFIAAVQAQTAKVQDAYKRGGRDLMSRATPQVLDAVKTIAVMQRRHGRGDLTHTTAEEDALKVYSQWLVEAWHRLHGTEVPETTWIKDR